nr:nucleolar protein 10 [Cryptomonas sp.]UXY87525.1 nucleolar protein 10 [Cryptomonas sp.]
MPNNNHEYCKKEYEKLSKNKTTSSIIDINFPSTVNKIKETQDACFLIGYGNYPPQIRCFDLNNLTLKFQRTVDCEIKDFQIISDNWEKLALLRSDKFIEFHSKSGYYYQIKIPKHSSSLLFDNRCKILYIPSIDGEVFRFNLELGKFVSSIKSNSKYINTSSANNIFNNLLSLGNSKGIIEIWDSRVVHKPISTIDGLLYLKKKENNIITCLNFCKATNYKFYAGFSSGEVVIYDLRNLTPIISKNMGNELPIKTIDKNKENNLILSADQKIIKIWDEISGKTLERIKTKKQINDVCLLKNTGFACISTKSPFVDSIYIPLLGPVPNWCFPLNYKSGGLIGKKENFIRIKRNINSYKKISASLDKLNLNKVNCQTKNICYIR